MLDITKQLIKSKLRPLLSRNTGSLLKEICGQVTARVCVRAGGGGGGGTNFSQHRCDSRSMCRGGNVESMCLPVTQTEPPSLVHKSCTVVAGELLRLLEHTNNVSKCHWRGLLVPNTETRPRQKLPVRNVESFPVCVPCRMW